MVEHELGIVVSMCGSLDAEVSKHGVRLPASQELDGVRVDPGAEEGGGSARPEGAGLEESGRDAGGLLEPGGGVAQGGGDELGFDGVPALIARVAVVVAEDGRVWRRPGPVQALGDAAQGLGGAKEGVVIGTVAHLLAFHCILLVGELKAADRKSVV